MNLLSNISISLLLLGLVGCGSNDSDTKEKSTKQSFEAIVERGPLIRATVQDSSTPRQIASNKSNDSNVYIFENEPIYPIEVRGGYIDLDSNGFDQGDVPYDGMLSSYSFAVTTATTFVGDPKTEAGKRRLEELKEISSLTEEELLKNIPSETSNEAVLLSNAIYENYYDYFHNEENTTVDFDDTEKLSYLKTIYTERHYATIASCSYASDTNTTDACPEPKRFSVTEESALFDKMEIFGLSSDELENYELNSVAVDYNSETIEHNSLLYGTTKSPYTGRVWLDRNLGANRVCSGMFDESCFGGMYQWGRSADGHENIDALRTTTINSSIANTNSKIVLGEAYRTYGYNEWTTDDSEGQVRSKNWLKTDGTSICPVGFRVPLIEEITDEFNGNIVNNYGAYNSFLRLPSTGTKTNASNINPEGCPYHNCKAGYLWSASIGNRPLMDSSAIYFGNDKVSSSQYWNRTIGLPVRCIKDENSESANQTEDNDESQEHTFMTWSEASDYCSSIEKNMPTYDELLSLYHLCNADNSCNQDWEWGHYWTQSSYDVQGSNFKTILMQGSIESATTFSYAPRDSSYKELVYCKDR